MQLQTEYNLESAIFLLFHPELVAQSGGGAGKLPLSLYETVWTNDSSMEVDGAERNQSLKFRELRYSVESGEAEMIGVDFVARGGANATAVEAPKVQEEKKGKGKAKDGETNGAAQPEQSYLSAEDDERMFAMFYFSHSTNILQSLLLSRRRQMQSRCCNCASTSSLHISPRFHHRILQTPASQWTQQTQTSTSPSFDPFPLSSLVYPSLPRQIQPPSSRKLSNPSLMSS
jgi:COP9 signalosome complex subunit 6